MNMMGTGYFFTVLCIWSCLSNTEGRIKQVCGPNEFPCDNGSCIPKSRWCDSKEDCEDDSDEHYCFHATSVNKNPNRCRDNFFLCKDGPCIPIVGLCDGYVSCPDGSDEVDCHQTTILSQTEIQNLTTYTTQVIHTTSQPLAVPSTQLLQSTVLPLEPETFKPIRHDVLSDSPHSETKESLNKFKADILKGYVKLDSQYFSHEKHSAESWLLSVRDEDFGWGDETARAITALYLSDPDLTRKKTQDSMLMDKQLHLKLSVTLVRNQTKAISLSELSSYINALHATCHNPKNFHGHDLVQILRQRTNVAQAHGAFINPSVYLTLCISNATIFSDVTKVQEMVQNTYKADRLDMLAILSLATSCISRIPQFVSTRIGYHIATRLLQKVNEVGLPENVYELPLVIQALDEAKVNQDLWNRSEAFHHLISLQHPNGSFGDVLATYYTLPALSGKSLVSLASHCYEEKEKGMIPVEVLMNGKEEKDFVSYSLNFGQPVSVSQSLRIRVRKSANLLDVMRIAAATNPIYSFKFDMARGRPFVYSIGGIVNDAEQGLYWSLYIARNSTKEQFTGDLRSFYPTSADHVIFWFKNLY